MDKDLGDDEEDEDLETEPATPASWSVTPRLGDGPGEPPLVIPEYLVINVVATGDVGSVVFDLKGMAQKHFFFDYNPGRFAAATWRIKDPKTTALMFPKGRFVWTGAKSEKESNLAAQRYVRVLQMLHYPVWLHNFQIQNIVACAACGFLLKLYQLSTQYSAYVSYEPALFPGCIFRMPDHGLVFLAFRSGKVVITGAKERSQITREWNWFFTNVLSRYRDDNTQPSSADYRLYCQRMSDSLTDDIVGKVIQMAIEARGETTASLIFRADSEIQDTQERETGFTFELAPWDIVTGNTVEPTNE